MPPIRLIRHACLGDVYYTPQICQTGDRVMLESRDEREKELHTLGATDCIRLVRIYQAVIGTPNGQIPIPGISHSRMVAVILKKGYPQAGENGVKVGALKNRD